MKFYHRSISGAYPAAPTSQQMQHIAQSAVLRADRNSQIDYSIRQLNGFGATSYPVPPPATSYPVPPPSPQATAGGSRQTLTTAQGVARVPYKAATVLLDAQGRIVPSSLAGLHGLAGFGDTETESAALSATAIGVVALNMALAVALYGFAGYGVYKFATRK